MTQKGILKSKPAQDLIFTAKTFSVQKTKVQKVVFLIYLIKYLFIKYWGVNMVE